MLVRWNPHDFAIIGYLGEWLDDDDPRGAKEQFHEKYTFGGWQPFQGFVLGADNSLTYPDDPPQYPRAEARLRDELVLLYPHSWVAVIQPDRTFEVARMD